MLLDDLYLFSIIVDCGSLSRAAKQLNSTVATVSRRLCALEDKIGQPLLNRHARGIHVTQAGEQLYRQYAADLQTIQTQLKEFKSQSQLISGRIKVLAPSNLAATALADFWPEFMRTYPKLQLDIQTSNHIQDIAEQGADCAIRVGHLPSSSLVQKRLGTIESKLVAAPEYPDIMCVTGLSDHTFAISQQINNLTLSHPSQGDYKVTVTPTHFCNDIALLKAMVKSGRCIALLPLSEASSCLQSGTLKTVLPQWSGVARPVYLVTTSRKYPSPKVTAFADMLKQFIAQQPWAS
ncbi:LysR family transcriptional regulator [Pseudoalteromonas luteoviolacea]|uniref:HTH lysR-type domain-containing protein n=1 Tax=Pseudoalteromonas luteoviolacea S4054 TaxID=1129367 RepID=A0A0F6ACQ7_9GAMM|nr:LysR family transcriptional regulator [Pseudoalteromonas luteoviolacea]AOT08832.1 hypothetical protein S4054249_13640 [Pseudoalteromonas luteoviolacea]AOT13745.1 hypothetical protein S40542_13610 [Pseudoalteromonas luteoviolacea]AOT18659.1 hypothetical protein S4054_13615 [Pseudoalteromonas luteoviolacea]KKE83606.1 hypothetical protein N479_13175 [Pseudoalteromonas luteoviolacea S4054]KZN72795.1 hypothetical protein N481_14310 [Pseudoalteromonas luteoviolacea S4047-1]